MLKELVLTTGIISSAGFFGGPDLTPEAQAVRSVTDTNGCRFIESSHLESRAQFIQDYVKRNAAQAGGDSYKIINVSQDYVVSVPISVVSYEVYNCREKPAPKVVLTPSNVNELDPEHWGEKRCDLAPPESRELCMAAHVRLSIAPDSTLSDAASSPESGTAAGESHGEDCAAVRDFASKSIAEAYPEALKRAAFAPDLRAAVKEYVIALKAFSDGAGQKVQVDHAKASLEIELAAACGSHS